MGKEEMEGSQPLLGVIGPDIRWFSSSLNSVPMTSIFIEFSRDGDSVIQAGFFHEFAVFRGNGIILGVNEENGRSFCAYLFFW